jgi:very-short-patch-repair endonuclease
MELDLYNAKRRLAVEYDGQHHYEYPNWYHTSREEFEAQQARDRAKDELCAERGVLLVRVRCVGSPSASRTAEEVRECVARLVEAGILPSVV